MLRTPFFKVTKDVWLFYSYANEIWGMPLFHLNNPLCYNHNQQPQYQQRNHDSNKNHINRINQN